MISFIRRCYETETKPITLEEVFDAIKTGAHGLKPKITQIHNQFESELALTGSIEKAKKLVAPLKQELPGFIITGVCTDRSTGIVVDYTGQLVADLDNVPEDEIPKIRDFLKTSPFVHAIFRSVTNGLKIVFNVVKDIDRHEDSFRAVQQFVREWTGLEIDVKCKDVTRIHFFSHDPEIWVRTEGNEPIPPADPLPSRCPTPWQLPPDMPVREQVGFKLLGELKYSPEKDGFFCRCPNESQHTNKTADKHTILFLSGVPTLFCSHLSCGATIEAFNKVLRSEIGKLENPKVSHVTFPYRDVRSDTILVNPNGEKVLAPGKPLIRFRRPNDLENLDPPTGIQLIGDHHIDKDGSFVFVIGGPAGVGKSLTFTSLAVAGARGEGEWFGMVVHRKFKTMIIQTENGLYRLSRNFKELDCKELDDYVRISEPPPYGLVFRRDDFRKELAGLIAEFGPDIVGLDPWNSVARDQEQRTYLETFDLVRSVLPTNTVLGIAAHTRKPQKDERSTGRGLMNILAGSHVLTSVPRTVFCLQYASDDVEDDEVVWTCCKNNDGELGKRTAWRRKIGLFEPVHNFDWETFDSADKDKRVVVTAEMVEEVFEGGQILIVEARDKLLEVSGASKSAVYRALSKKKSRFVDNLSFQGKFVNWIRS